MLREVNDEGAKELFWWSLDTRLVSKDGYVAEIDVRF